MANLQHYIHYKLQNKQRLLRSLKEKSKEERKRGRRGVRDFTHTLSLTQTNVESLTCTIGGWKVNMIQER